MTEARNRSLARPLPRPRRCFTAESNCGSAFTRREQRRPQAEVHDRGAEVEHLAGAVEPAPPSQVPMGGRGKQRRMEHGTKGRIKAAATIPARILDVVARRGLPSSARRSVSTITTRKRSRSTMTFIAPINLPVERWFRMREMADYGLDGGGAENNEGINKENAMYRRNGPRRRKKRRALTEERHQQRGQKFVT